MDNRRGTASRKRSADPQAGRQAGKRREGATSPGPPQTAFRFRHAGQHPGRLSPAQESGSIGPANPENHVPATKTRLGLGPKVLADPARTLVGAHSRPPLPPGPLCTGRQQRTGKAGCAGWGRGMGGRRRAAEQGPLHRGTLFERGGRKPGRTAWTSQEEAPAPPARVGLESTPTARSDQAGQEVKPRPCPSALWFLVVTGLSPSASSRAEPPFSLPAVGPPFSCDRHGSPQLTVELDGRQAGSIRSSGSVEGGERARREQRGLGLAVGAGRGGKVWESEGGERHEEDQTRKGGQGRVGPHAEVYISFLSFPLPLVWPYPRRSAWLVAGVGGVVVCRARSEQQQPTGHCSSARKRSQGLQEGPVGLRLAGWPGGALARGSNPPRAGPRSHKRGEKARGAGWVRR